MYLVPSFSVAGKNPRPSREDVIWWKRSDLDERPTVIVQSPRLSRLTPTVASERAIDRLDPRLREASTIVARDLGSARPVSSLDCGFWFSVIGSAEPPYLA